VTAREIGRVTIAEALELTAPVARKQPHRYGRFAARWLCLYLEEHESATLEDVALLVSKLRPLAIPKAHASALAILKEGSTEGLRLEASHALTSPRPPSTRRTRGRGSSVITARRKGEKSPEPSSPLPTLRGCSALSFRRTPAWA